MATPAWAVDHHGDEGAVVAAQVSLDGCLDLLNPRWHRALSEADDQYVNDCVAQGYAAAQNRPRAIRRGTAP